MTEMVLRDAAVGRGPAAALPPVSLHAPAGAVTVVATEGGQRPTVLSLVASGRMAVDAGSVDAPRQRIALVDTPTVAEHPGDVRVGAVLREELALAGRRGTRRELGRLGLDDWMRRPFAALPAADRIRLLGELALARPGVDALVVTSPERHGGDPAAWFRELRVFATRGAAVLVVTDHATHRALPDIPAPPADAIPLFEGPRP